MSINGKIRYHGSGARLLVGKVMTARKQIGKADIYRYQHYNGYYDGFPYVVPESVYARTPSQQAWRDAFRQAMLAWNALPEDEKEGWREKAVGKPVLGHNLYVREWLKNYKNQGR